MKAPRTAGSEPYRILVRCPNWVGDLAMATPALAALRLGFPRARITLLLRPGLVGLVRGLDSYDDLILLRQHEPAGQRQGLRAIARSLRPKRFDLVLILPNSFSSALIAWMAKIPRRVGYRRYGRGWLLSDSIPPPRAEGVVGSRFLPTPMVDYYCTLVRYLGCPSDDPSLRLAITPEAEKQADEIWERHDLGNGAPVVAITPGAAFGSTKLWPPGAFAEAADRLCKSHSARILLLPAPDERPIAERIASRMKQGVACLPEEPIGLELLKSLINRSSVLLTNDSGPRHFGEALGRPTVVIMGPTDPRYTDYPYRHTEILREEVACGPCHLKSCPIDHRCMTRIRPERAAAAVARHLERPPAARPTAERGRA